MRKLKTTNFCSNITKLKGKKSKGLIKYEHTWKLIDVPELKRLQAYLNKTLFNYKMRY